MGSAEDDFEARRRAREYVDTRGRDAQIAKAKRRFPGLHAKAVANLKRHHYPEKLGVNSRIVCVGGQKRVGWELLMPMTGSVDRDTPPSPGFYLLGEGELVRCGTSYDGEFVRLENVGDQAPDIVWGLERMVAYPHDPKSRPLWHRILR